MKPLSKFLALRSQFRKTLNWSISIASMYASKSFGNSKIPSYNLQFQCKFVKCLQADLFVMSTRGILLTFFAPQTNKLCDYFKKSNSTKVYSSWHLIWVSPLFFLTGMTTLLIRVYRVYLLFLFVRNNCVVDWIMRKRLSFYEVGIF